MSIGYCLWLAGNGEWRTGGVSTTWFDDRGPVVGTELTTSRGQGGAPAGGAVLVGLACGGSSGAAVRAALAAVPGVVVIPDVVDLGDVAAAVDQRPAEVVVTDLPDVVELGAPSLARLVAACVGVVLVTAVPLRERVLGWVRVGVRGVVATDELEYLPMTVAAAARRKVFVSPTPATMVIEGTEWPLLAPPVSPTLAQARAILTPQQQVVLRAVVAGTTTAKIAADLSMKPSTVRQHLAAVFAKLDVHDRTNAVAWAYRSGFVTPRS